MATRSPARQRAVPKTMTATRFDSVLRMSGRVAVLFVGTLALVVALSLGQPILAPLSLAMVVGLMCGPVADAMEKRGIMPALSAGVVLIIFLGVLALAAFMFAVPISEWFARGPLIWQKLQTQLAGLKQPLESLAAVQDQLKTLWGADTAMTVEVKDGGPVQSAALMAPTLLADMLLFLAGLYFFLASRHQLRIAVLSLCFSRQVRWRTAHVFRDIEQKVSRFLLSAALINLGVGVATALATWALGLPSPLLWGALAAVMNFVPYIGQAVMITVLLAVGLGTQSTLPGIVLPAIAYGAINLTADQVLFPHLVGRALTLNPFIIFVSTAFWLWLWGPMGGFVAVPSLLVLQSLILHVFPTTAAIPARTERKLQEAKVAAAPPEPAETPPEVPKPRPQRSTRKAAIATSP